MTSTTHRLAAPAPRPTLSLARLRRAVRAVGRLYADRRHLPAQSFWHDGDLPSVPYSALGSLHRYR